MQVPALREASVAHSHAPLLCIQWPISLWIQTEIQSLYGLRSRSVTLTKFIKELDTLSRIRAAHLAPYVLRRLNARDKHGVTRSLFSRKVKVELMPHLNARG